MSELDRLRKEYDAAVKRRHATGLEIRADALIAAFEDAVRGCHRMLEYERGLRHVIVANRMLQAEYDSPTPRTAGYMRWYSALRARAEKEAELFSLRTENDESVKKAAP